MWLSVSCPRNSGVRRAWIPGLVLAVLSLLPYCAAAQLTDNFADGDFTQSPAWSGDAASFTVAAQQLQSNGPATTGTVLQLVTPCQAVTGTTWEFYASLRLATSSGNYADVWLLADNADLKATGTKGYFVRLGGTPDEVALFRKDATGSPAYVVNGQDATLASTTNNTVRVRVTRSVQNVWTLERDLTGGTTFVAEGSAPDATYLRSTHFGLVLTYSSTNNRGFFFDDFRVSDTAPPQLIRGAVTAARQLDLTFNEAVAPAQSAAAYRLSTGSPAVTAAQRDAVDPTLVHLTVDADLPTGPLIVEARTLTDLFGNTDPGPQTTTFVNSGFAIVPGVNQVLITEIMADETPVVGLPASEFIEIHNPSATAVIDLAGIRLQKPGGTTAAVFQPGQVLLPGEYAVVCGTTRVTQFTGFGKVFGLTNFPSLSNGGDQLVLRGRNGRTLFELAYSDTWYKDSRKKEGGWTLEMVDVTNPCAGIENWTASTDASGGTPARANSVRATNADRTAPALLRALASAPTAVKLFFAEKLDSATMANPALYALSPANAIAGVSVVGPDFRTVELTLTNALQASQPVTVSVQRAVDCAGNAAGPATSAAFALPAPVASGDVVINEILFNPRTGGVDFVELLNRSAKYLNLQAWQLGSEKTDGSVDAVSISAGPYVLAPGQLVVLTTRPDLIQSQYPTHDPAAFLPMNDFPTYADKEGIVVLYDGFGRLLDRYAYNETQHLALLDDLNGVSLERIRAEGPSQPGNFHSAASAVGYATPGRPNSQYQEDPGGSQQFSVAPDVFTPDGDGQQDFTTLNFHLDQVGYAASVTVYDALGRLTRRLVRNETVPTNGFFQWDGLTDRGDKAPVGYYVLLVELFQPNGGQKREFKKTVVLGARF
ncbi:lamin tail domain-containing protein [Hymenobacter sp. BT175]|uniref:lamin tail domain-containing protein n=1 Tax=Hymenobacter translucens TaxID=2886507 RepID=UPI001D0E3BA0|nr:lamin tail domain-containing protein [Hymenobacter translucens]MCC2548905.1 lamin tail domain-containing protein [Hymenobacter translucens]